jgi:hypothetical protein
MNSGGRGEILARRIIQAMSSKAQQVCDMIG